MQPALDTRATRSPSLLTPVELGNSRPGPRWSAAGHDRRQMPAPAPRRRGATAHVRVPPSPSLESCPIRAPRPRSATRPTACGLAWPTCTGSTAPASACSPTSTVTSPLYPRRTSSRYGSGTATTARCSRRPSRARRPAAPAARSHRPRDLVLDLAFPVRHTGPIRPGSSRGHGRHGPRHYPRARCRTALRGAVARLHGGAVRESHSRRSAPPTRTCLASTHNLDARFHLRRLHERA